MSRPKTLLSWSSGKDSAWALHVLREAGEYDVVGLLTTVNRTHERVAMHAVREALLEAQAEAVGLPLTKIDIPSPCSNAEYEEAMGKACADAVARDITHIAFGDLYLEDIRRYREEKLAGTGLTPVFPIFGEPSGTAELAHRMVEAGVRAQLTAVDPKQLDPRFAGRTFDAQLLDELPEGVDLCGENGEFHTFAWSGPAFRAPVAVRAGEVVERDGFVFADCLPATEG